MSLAGNLKYKHERLEINKLVACGNFINAVLIGKKGLMKKQIVKINATKKKIKSIKCSINKTNSKKSWFMNLIC